MRASWYAKALYDLETSSTLTPEKLVEQFVGTVEANGHLYMLPRILRAYERSTSKQEKRETIEVTTAFEMAQSEVLALLRSEPYSNILSPKHKRVVRKVDSNVIGGVIARTSTSRVDMSHKNMLIQIYQNMTNQL